MWPDAFQTYPHTWAGFPHRGQPIYVLDLAETLAERLDGSREEAGRCVADMSALLARCPAH
jgi:hypothetical protein